jgi:hypothetical protein
MSDSANYRPRHNLTAIHWASQLQPFNSSCFRVTLVAIVFAVGGNEKTSSSNSYELAQVVSSMGFASVNPGVNTAEEAGFQ